MRRMFPLQFKLQGEMSNDDKNGVKSVVHMAVCKRRNKEPRGWSDFHREARCFSLVFNSVQRHRDPDQDAALCHGGPSVGQRLCRVFFVSASPQ